MTKQKQLILDIINNSCNHYTAEQVYIEAKKILGKIALGTVYNNLNSLVDEGKIRRLVFDGECDHFDKIFPMHDHLICSKCGKISDIMLTDLTTDIQNKLGFEISSYNLYINYICDNCKKM